MALLTRALGEPSRLATSACAAPWWATHQIRIAVVDTRVVVLQVVVPDEHERARSSRRGGPIIDDDEERALAASWGVQLDGQEGAVVRSAVQDLTAGYDLRAGKLREGARDDRDGGARIDERVYLGAFAPRTQQFSALRQPAELGPPNDVAVGRGTRRNCFHGSFHRTSEGCRA